MNTEQNVPGSVDLHAFEGIRPGVESVSRSAERDFRMARHVISGVPYIFQGSVPSCPETSLRMVLGSYGWNYASSYLRNLSGFNYGFKYFKDNQFALACAESPIGPWPHMVYAAEKMGCSIGMIKDQPWETTWNLMKDFLNRSAEFLMG